MRRALMAVALLIGAVPAASAQRVSAGGDTTAVRPGMTAAQVRAAWGEPSGTRVHGDYTYLYFANGCQPRCGIQDVVMLERGQVVDAIVRDPHHRYAGVSSSPATRKPEPTPPSPAPSTSHDR